MQKLIQKPNKFSQFSDLIEGAPHGLIHFAVGGKKGDFSGMMSPNDPFFWLHHAYLDKIWNDWQTFAPERFRLYNGKHRGRQVNSFDQMAPWNIPVYSTFNITDLRYQYLPFSKQKFRTETNSTIPISNNPGLFVNKEQLENSKLLIDRNNELLINRNNELSINRNNKLLINRNNIILQTENNTNLSSHKPNDSLILSNQKQNNTLITKLLLDGDVVDPIQIKNDEISPIPDEWIKHHGLDLEKFRKNEKLLQELSNEDNLVSSTSESPAQNSSRKQISISVKGFLVSFMFLCIIT